MLPATREPQLMVPVTYISLATPTPPLVMRDPVVALVDCVKSVTTIGVAKLSPELKVAVDAMMLLQVIVPLAVTLPPKKQFPLPIFRE